MTRDAIIATKVGGGCLALIIVAMVAAFGLVMGF